MRLDEVNKKITELRGKLEAKVIEIRELTKNNETEKGKQSLEEAESIKKELRDCEEMRDLMYQKAAAETNNEEGTSELRMINSDNVKKLYPNVENLSLGKYIRGALTGEWRNAEKEMNEYRALSTSTGAVIIPKQLSAEVLSAVMNKSLIYNSNVPVADMPNGNLRIAKVVKNPEFGFTAELEAADPQDATFEGVDLKSKKVYGLMKISLETLESADNIDIVLRQAMSDSIANAIDSSMLYGTDEKDIKGIFSYDTINIVEAESTNYIPFINAIGKIRTKNGEPTVMGINAAIDTKLNLLTDTTGQPLQIPKVVDNLNRVISNQLVTDVTNGDDSIIFDPNALIIGQQVLFKIEMSREKGFDDGSVWIRIYSLLDMALVRPEFITRIKGLK